MTQPDADAWAEAAADAMAAALMKDRPAVKEALSRLSLHERRRLADCMAWLSHEAARSAGLAAGRKYREPA